MKKERLEELVGPLWRDQNYFDIRDALLAVERETVERTKERCARVCDSVDNFANPMTANDCAAAIRSLLTEE